MSDASVAEVGRRLANALAKAAYERDLDSKKHVALLQTELCSTVREELAQGTEKPS